MRHITSAYGRALLPRGLETRDDATPTLAAGALDLALAGGIYRAVVAVEGLLDRLPAARRDLGKADLEAGQGRPVECG